MGKVGMFFQENWKYFNFSEIIENFEGEDWIEKIEKMIEDLEKMINCEVWTNWTIEEMIIG